MKTLLILLGTLAITLALPACDSKSGKKDDGHTDHTH